jgi:predicted phage terminase large subunit-like protein
MSKRLPISELDKLPLEELERRQRIMQRMEFATRAKNSLIDFAQFMNPDPNRPDDVLASTYSVQPHHRMIAEGLEALEGGKIMRMALSIPPQHGKSALTSRLFPPWFLGRSPWRNMMLGTYNQTFAEEFGGDVREIMKHPNYQIVFPGVGFRTGSAAKDHMVTMAGGKLSFLGRGGSGTGRPADCLIVDDPFKDRKEADSLTIRNDAWNWFTSVLNTRIHGLSWILIIMTRWSEDDIIGRLTDPRNKHYKESVAKQWKVINVPSIQDDPEIAKVLGKKVGDALWPERFPLSLLETARAMDPVTFSALYQGKPTPPEGAFFKRQSIFTYDSIADLPQNLRYYGAGDLAVSPERDADSSVVGTGGVDEDDVLWILPDLYWEKKAADESVGQIIEFVERYRWLDSFWEKGQIDRAVGPFLEKEAFERGVVLSMKRFPASGSKGFRATSIRGRMAQGKVRFPAFAPWWEKALDQMLKFTGTGDDPEDDFCDFIAMLGQGLQMQLGASKPKAAEKVVRVGSLEWIKAQSNRDRLRSEAKKRVAHV